MFRKRLYDSKLFGEKVWIVNLTIEQAKTDPEIAESGLMIFTETELTAMRAVPEADRSSVYGKIFSCKKALPGATVTYYGEEKARGEIAYAPEAEVLPDRPAQKEGPKRRRRYGNDPSIQAGDPGFQKRLI